MKKRALVTGITGQDGHHLTKLLLEKGYEVQGIVNGQRNSREQSFTSLFPEVKLMRGDLTDFTSLLQIVEEAAPQEIYNLGAISFVGMSFQQPELTANITGLGALRLLEAVRKVGLEKSTRIYQASSSEMFGKVRETPQTELTPFHPRSPIRFASGLIPLRPFPPAACSMSCDDSSWRSGFPGRSTTFVESAVEKV